MHYDRMIGKIMLAAAMLAMLAACTSKSNVNITSGGGTVQNPWVRLPGESGLMRGSLYIDRTGVFGGDLIVVTTAGGVWRVNAAGLATSSRSARTAIGTTWPRRSWPARADPAPHRPGGLPNLHTCLRVKAQATG